MTDPNKVSRMNAKSSLTRFITHFNAVKVQPNINISDLQLRCNKAEELIETFNNAQLKIEADDPDCEANYDVEHAVERLAFEDRYYKIISEVKSFIESKVTPPLPVSDSSSSSGRSPLNNIALPQLNLPTFDGSFEQWLFFRDSFASIIHENNDLSDVQKFHYLRLSLRGSAADMIKSLQVSSDNYSLAWNLLSERFENKHLLVNFHIKALFNLNTLTKESRDGLRHLLDDTQKHLRALSVLQCPTQHWDDLIIYLVSTKLDNATRRAWESQNKSGNLPKLNDLLEFLKDRCRVLESIEVSNNRGETSKHAGFQRTTENTKASRSFYSANSDNTSSDNQKCIVCNKVHIIYNCPDFIKLNPHDRQGTAKRLRLCINCLRIGHSTRQCKSSGCRRCGKIHHTMLHFQTSQLDSNSQNSSESQAVNPSQLPTNNSQSSQKHIETLNHHVNMPSNLPHKSQILLSTAVVNVFDSSGNPHPCRVLLDNGSQSNFISERLCNILQLPKKEIHTTISSINQATQTFNAVASVRFKSTINNYERNISCLILPKITGNLPFTSIDSSLLKIPDKISLADPNFGHAAPVDLLIGADTFWDLLSIGQIKLDNGGPILHKTKLGWVISGPLFAFNNSAVQHCHFTTSNIDIQLLKFWEIEEFPKTIHLSDEETLCENYYKQSVARSTDGHFIVKMPLKHSPEMLGDSHTLSTKRFLSLERKLDKNPDLKLQYHTFIKEYINLGHMSLSENQNDHKGCFLPHHCVLKESSTTTKLRVVFDGSQKTDSGYSLNDIMTFF